MDGCGIEYTSRLNAKRPVIFPLKGPRLKTNTQFTTGDPFTTDRLDSIDFCWLAQHLRSHQFYNQNLEKAWVELSHSQRNNNE